MTKDTKDTKDTKGWIVKIKELDINAEAKTIILSKKDQAEIEDTFAKAKDFREVWEKITAPIDSILSETAKVIDADPIMKVSDELKSMNWEVSSVYKDIIDNDWTIMKIMKSIPLVWSLAKSLDEKLDEAKFNIKWIEWKIEIIFSGFDTSYNSVNTSIDLQMKFLDWIDQNVAKVIAYKDFVWIKLDAMKWKLSEAVDEKEKMKLELFIRNVEFFQTNLIVLIGNLEMARKRLMMRLDSANKLSLAMSSSRPIFKTLLSTAIIETSSQKAIDASMAAMNIMWSTIDKMTSDLTDKAIESSKKAEEMTSKPVVSTAVFIENVTKLKNHFDEIEDFRERIESEAKAERKLFIEAKSKLDNLKTLSASDTQKLNDELIQK